jgi:hypothetical protein
LPVPPSWSRARGRRAPSPGTSSPWAWPPRSPSASWRAREPRPDGAGRRARRAPASALALPFAEPLSVGARDLGLLALFGVGQFAAGFLLFTAGAPLIPAAEASLIGLLETVLGPLWVWLALGEEPGPRTLFGGAMVLGAMVIHATLDFVAPGPDTVSNLPRRGRSQ